MKIFQSMNLLLVASSILLASCGKENVMSESLQVTNQRISITCFEKSMEDIGSAPDLSSSSTATSSFSRSSMSQLSTRGNSPVSLKEAHHFSELEVALIPIDDEEDTSYVVRQDSTNSNFGKIQLDVPAGTYHMIAVAIKNMKKVTSHVAIQNSSKITFPDDVPTDMVYAYKQVTVSTSKSKQAFDATMTRGVSAFRLRSTELPPLNFVSEKVSIYGNCGIAFNPITGKCVERCPLSRTFSFDPNAIKDKKILMDMFVFLGEDDVSDLQVDAQAFDKDGKVIRDLHFDNVHLEKAKVTKYEGAIFSSSNTASFTVNSPEMEESEYSMSF